MSARLDLKIEMFGLTWDTPNYISAVGGLKAFHPEGELADCPCGQNQEHRSDALDANLAPPVEEVAKSLGTPPWFQLMRQCGTPAISQITRASVLRNGSQF